MKKLKLIISTILITIVISCKKENVENKQNSKSVDIEHFKLKDKVLETEIKLTSLKEIPKEIDGCACVYSETEKKFKAEEYLIATNIDSIAFISINGKITKLKLVERKTQPNPNDNKDYIDTFESGKFKVTIKVRADKTKKEEYESWWSIGTIKIEDENGKSQTKEIIGECGC